MKQPWWALVIVAVLGIGVGTTTTTLVGNDATAGSGSSTTVDPVGSAAEPANSSEPTAPPNAADTTSSTTSSTTSTTAPNGPDTTDTGQPALDDLEIVVANGAGIGGVAATTAQLLNAIGYPNVAIADGGDIFGGTVLYVADGFVPTAERIVAEILSVDPTFVPPLFIVPLTDAPAITPAFPDAEIIIYLGQDQR